MANQQAQTIRLRILYDGTPPNVLDGGARDFGVQDKANGLLLGKAEATHANHMRLGHGKALARVRARKRGRAILRQASRRYMPYSDVPASKVTPEMNNPLVRMEPSPSVSSLSAKYSR